LKWKDRATLIRAAVDQLPQQRHLADLADDVTTLLKRAMELFELIQKADSRQDRSYSDQPSISPHEQNSGFRDWTLLIELVRDSWRQVLNMDRQKARAIVERWRSIPYPVFRRLCFYAMSESDLYTPGESAEYLLDEGAWWVWSTYVYREKFRLLNAIWPSLADEEADRIVSCILDGPPRSMFRDDISQERFTEMTEREIWLHLAKLADWGRKLPANGAQTLRTLQEKHPEWQMAGEDRNEFVFWMEGGVAESPDENDDEFVTLADDALLARLSAGRAEDNKDVQKW